MQVWGLGCKRIERGLGDVSQTADENLPLQLNTIPIGSPKGLVNERVSNYLSELGLSFRPIHVGHLAKTPGDPLPKKRER